jgi:hypothetical protein
MNATAVTSVAELFDDHPVDSTEADGLPHVSEGDMPVSSEPQATNVCKEEVDDGDFQSNRTFAAEAQTSHANLSSARLEHSSSTIELSDSDSESEVEQKPRQLRVMQTKAEIDHRPPEEEDFKNMIRFRAAQFRHERSKKEADLLMMYLPYAANVLSAVYNSAAENTNVIVRNKVKVFCMKNTDKFMKLMGIQNTLYELAKEVRRRFGCSPAAKEQKPIPSMLRGVKENRKIRILSDRRGRIRQARVT